MPPGDWRSAALDLGHVPLFALVAVLLHSMELRLAAVTGAGVFLAAAGEIVQHWSGRQPSIADFLFGTAGVLIGAVWIYVSRHKGWKAAAFALFTTITLSAWPVASAAPTFWDLWVAYRDFPVLSSFLASGELARWHGEQARIQRIADPLDDSQYAGEITFIPGPKSYSAATLYPHRWSWECWRYLCWEISVEKPTVLSFKIEDLRQSRTHFDRFNRRFHFEPGDHKVAIPVEDIVSAPKTFPLDLSRIERIQWKCRGSRSPVDVHSSPRLARMRNVESGNRPEPQQGTGIAS